VPAPAPEPGAGRAGGPEALARRLAGYLDDPHLLHRALAHRSYCAEAPGEESNERLEFLGDAVLGLVATEELYRAHPDLPEGDLARMRAAIVSTGTLAQAAAELGVGDAVLLGRGEEASGGRSKASILADALEALIGATYLAGGLAPARALVLDLLGERLAAAPRDAAALGDAKNRLQELAARLGLEPPSYCVEDEGPDHAKRFRASVAVGGRVVGHGEGRSKKAAERAAADEGLAVLAAGERA